MIVEAGELGLSSRKLLVESAGFNCLSALSIDQTNRFLDRHQVDLLLFDSDVAPGETAVGFLKQFKRERQLPAYVLTGSAFVPESFRDVVNGNFQKALDPAIMIEEVVRVLG